MKSSPSAPGLDLGDGRFSVDRVIAEGGTARVFHGVDRSTGLPVAVKVMRQFPNLDSSAISRFVREADLLARLDHPNLLPLVGRGELENGCPWFATGYASQGSLADQMVRHGTLPAREFLANIAEVLDALHYLHGLGIVHRDVKPENVLLDDDDVAMLSDFGIAYTARWSASPYACEGTPAFVPPEQFADPTRVLPQADLFGAGVTLFVGLTGQTGMMLLVDQLRPGALSTLPRPIAAFVDRATSLRVEDRYASAWEMSLDLADLL